jgi:hypothetical protein
MQPALSQTPPSGGQQSAITTFLPRSAVRAVIGETQERHLGQLPLGEGKIEAVTEPRQRRRLRSFSCSYSLSDLVALAIELLDHPSLWCNGLVTAAACGHSGVCATYPVADHVVDQDRCRSELVMR